MLQALNYDFVAPPKIVFGWGRRRELATLARSIGHRAMILSGLPAAVALGRMGDHDPGRAAGGRRGLSRRRPASASPARWDPGLPHRGRLGLNAGSPGPNSASIPVAGWP